MKSFFPYKGGKSRMARLLMARIPEHICYVEVFAGAANLMFAKEPSKTEVINDVNSELINLFRVCRWHPREFMTELQLTCHSRTEFADYKAQPGLTDIQRAARTYYIFKSCFGGKGGCPESCFGYKTTGRSGFRRTVFSVIRRCSKRLDGVTIENLDFADLIARYDRVHTFFYCDPPYIETSGYTADFSNQDHERLADSLRGIKGKFLLTIDDCARARRLYKGFHIRGIDVNYSIARVKTKEASARKELIITNYNPPGQRRKT